MNVLLVNTFYPSGSTGRIAEEIAAYAAKQPDTRVMVAFGIGNPPEMDNVTAVRFGSKAGRKLHGAIRKLLDMEGYGSYFATGRMIRFCKKNHVDVIHMHNLHGCYINLKRWIRFLKRSGIPVIWTLHDCWTMTGHCAYFSEYGCEKWKTQCEHCPQERDYPVCIGLDGSRRNYRFKKKLFTQLSRLTIITPCRWLAEVVGQSYLKNTDTWVICNGVDTGRFYPRISDLRKQYGLESKRVLLAAASEWDRRKGLDSLLALSQLLDDTYKIVILGLTREQIAAIPRSILALERTASQDELAAWYSAADCLVNPTLDDTMPLVNLEALACGTPIVAYNTGGCPEAIGENCGAIVEKGDVPALADAVQSICESGKEYKDACVRQAKRFTTQVMVRSYYEYYLEVSQ